MGFQVSEGRPQPQNNSKVPKLVNEDSSLEEPDNVDVDMAEYEEEQETEAERKVREFVVEKKAQNMPEYDPNGLPKDFSDKYHNECEEA